MFTVPMLALEIRQPEHRVRRAVASGKIPATRAGRIHLIRAEDVPLIRERMAGSGTQRPAPADRPPGPPPHARPRDRRPALPTVTTR